jgi:phage FluMu gp28-like protein
MTARKNNRQDTKNAKTGAGFPSLGGLGGLAVHPSATVAVSPKSLMLPYQRRFADDSARFKIAVMSRQTGKSFCTAEEAVENCLTEPGAMWVCLSAGERQALEWLEKAKDWSTAFKLAVETYAEDRGMAEALLKSAEIRYANGSRIVAVPANPNTARGYSANVILDEFAYHEDPDKIWAAMFPSATNPLAGTFLSRVNSLITGQVANFTRALKVRIVSTFNGKDNKFFKLWEKAAEIGYTKHLVTIYDAVRDGLPVNIEELKAALDDADAWAQEFECAPTDTSNVLLPYDLIALAESADAVEVIGPEFFEAHGGNPIYCGIDFGRTNDPTVCWTLEQIGDILWTREVLVLRGMSSPDQREILRGRIRRASRVCFDYTGPGVGLGDELVKEFGEHDPAGHKFGKVELFTFTAASKRELFPKLRRRFEAPCKLRIPISRQVREDLHAMQQVVNNGEYQYWAPHTREGHSDRCTALALAVRAAGDGRSGAITSTKGFYWDKQPVTA